MDNPDDRKSADSYNWTLGVEQEYKVSKTPTFSSIDRLLRSANKQAEHVVLSVESDISLEDLSAAIRARLFRSENIRTLTIIYKNKDITFSKETILTEGFKIRPADLK